MSGPLTPPPSSALEIEDAARITIVPETVPPTTAPELVPPPTDAPPEIPEQPVVQPAPIPSPPTPLVSQYRQAFVAIIDLASREKFEELVQVAEPADLSVSRSHHTCHEIDLDV